MTQLPKSESCIHDAVNLNEVSKQRVEQLAVAAERLGIIFPEIAGLTIYGSVARGGATEHSDVDILVFAEQTTNETSPQNSLRIPQASPLICKSDSLPETTAFHTAVMIDYKLSINEELIETGIEESDIDVLPISPAIIDENVNELLEAAKCFGADEDFIWGVARNLRGLFHQAIGRNRLQTYIDQALNGLSNDGVGSLAWAMLRNQVIGFEKGRDGVMTEPPRHLPESLEAARQQFTGR